MSHTPGPWNCSEDGAEVWPMTGDTSHVELARVVGPWCGSQASSWYGREVARANGRLIAAAPDLLAACQLLVALEDSDASDADTRWKQARRDMRDAIAKAQGGTK